MKVGSQEKMGCEDTELRATVGALTHEVDELKKTVQNNIGYIRYLEEKVNSLESKQHEYNSHHQQQIVFTQLQNFTQYQQQGTDTQYQQQIAELRQRLAVAEL
jgi:phage shock protein A